MVFSRLGAVADGSMGSSAARQVPVTQHEEKDCWAPLAGTMLAAESHHLILLFPGPGTHCIPIQQPPFLLLRAVSGCC